MYTKSYFFTPFKGITKYIRNLGQGSQGRVDLHELNGNPEIQPYNSDKVAIKTFFPDAFDDIDEGTLQELHVLFRFINCNNIIQLLDVDGSMIDGKPIIRIMFPFYTNNLRVFIETVPFTERLKYSQTIINHFLIALYQLYLKGILHRDIKPENILVDYNFDANNKQLLDEPQVYLADFGLAIQLPCNKKYRDIELVDDIGTPLYRAPEILVNHDHYTEKVDMWSMGVTFVDFFLNKIFTEPTVNLYRAAGENPDIAVSAQIIDNLIHPLPLDGADIQRFRNLEIHDNVDIHKVFSDNFKESFYNRIPANVITLMTKMLDVHPDDRLSIVDLFPGTKVCHSSVHHLERGELFPGTQVTVSLYYRTIELLLKIAENLRYHPGTAVSAIDLLDRYLHNYVVTKKQLVLIAATCSFLLAKTMETMGIDPDKFLRAWGNFFTLGELEVMELNVLDKVRYLLSACETGDYINAIMKLTDEKAKSFSMSGIKPEQKIYFAELQYVYPILRVTYGMIAKDKKYSGNLFYFEILYYLKKATEAKKNKK